MTNTPKTRARLIMSILAMTLVVGVSLSLGPSTNAQSTYEEVSSGTVDTVFAIAPTGVVDGSTIVFNLNSFNIYNLSLSGDPDLQTWANDVATDAGSGLMSGTLSVDASGHTIPLSTSATLPVQLYASTDGSSVDADLSYSGTLVAAAGFSGSDLAVSDSPDGGSTSGGEVYATDIGFEQDQEVAASMSSRLGSGFFRTVAFDNTKSKFKGRAAEWRVPNAGLTSLEVTVNNWGKTPKELRKLEKHSVRVETTAFEYDALTGSASVKQNVKIKKKNLVA